MLFKKMTKSRIRQNENGFVFQPKKDGVFVDNNLADNTMTGNLQPFIIT